MSITIISFPSSDPRFSHCRAIRYEVFVCEQRVDPEEEWDETDNTALHFLALDGEAYVGCGRIFPDGSERGVYWLGRLAVLRAYRGAGTGAALVRAMHAEALRRGAAEMRIHAQTHVRQFYERLGYAACGALFFEAGIEHVEMRAHIMG